MASTYETSRAAPASDKFRTAQLNAARSNSMVAPLSTRRRIALRFSSMCPAFFWAPWREFLQRRLVRAVNKLLKRHTVHAETHGRSKTIRVAAADSYKEHGATQWFHYTNNTDAIYEIMYGGTAAQLRRQWGLPRKINVRDHLTTEQCGVHFFEGIFRADGEAPNACRAIAVRRRILHLCYLRSANFYRDPSPFAFSPPHLDFGEKVAPAQFFRKARNGIESGPRPHRPGRFSRASLSRYIQCSSKDRSAGFYRRSTSFPRRLKSTDLRFRA